MIETMYNYGHISTSVRLLNKPYGNEVILRGQNIPLKCCQELFIYIGRGFTSFHSGNMPVSVGQRAASCHRSNSEDDSNPVGVKFKLTGWNRAKAEQQTFS